MTTETKSRKKKVAYFYDYLIGDYDYGPNHPMKPHRIRMTDALLHGYDLIREMAPIQAQIGRDDLMQFHAEDYIEFLETVDHQTFPECDDVVQKYNVNEDCPVFEGLWDFIRTYSAGSIGGAQHINSGASEIAINWSGGLHHGKKMEASGFCYANDCVLACIELLKRHERVLYIDIDIHHGDGVEEAFYTSPRCMCVSFHKFGEYFPGTGAIEDTGSGAGHGYSINVPLQDGVTDEMFIDIFTRVMNLVRSRFDPQAVVLQCGADSLSGDRLGCFNLTLEGHGYAVEYVKNWRVPMVVLGGGGYTLRNVAKCWTYETAVLLEKELDPVIPEDTKYLGYYGPDCRLEVLPSSVLENHNSRADMDKIEQQLVEVMKGKVFATNAGIKSAAVNDSGPFPVLNLQRSEQDDDADVRMTD
uniref:Histone deacetylase n=1 Tax=Chromera velia CCMP2878 TaxID=1169474 RepID=A0A0G4FGJ8_9ALVE|mmetsp:Transcript_26103/g.51228  ORF Transcript_26103/g.51228 Transcript_26103/m.51228 type:complete len:415 (+) Transcript_26103:193-1437(+)|eukprot:Cvel_3290.t1-p1 / transcript=Cvel_3290.t1 / gene=Cvel_3290 / organism=Chromera_velia_CCMP2878 / gene_product=Histone deacetylase clr6, putative / transcript_product=Histone deacetylase clr6, putative / location=Cvel_scaffold129:105993-113460(+) / protein_length=414 / sequence_SO=supercontig / SO=protein_coding / is_pseudo=false